MSFVTHEAVARNQGCVKMVSRWHLPILFLLCLGLTLPAWAARRTFDAHEKELEKQEDDNERWEKEAKDRESELITIADQYYKDKNYRKAAEFYRKVLDIRYKQWEFRESSVVRQPLLFPATLELTVEEAGKVEFHQETLLRMGLEVEPFGGATVAVKSIPALLTGADPDKLLLEVVDGLEEVKGSTGLDDKLDRTEGLGSFRFFLNYLIHEVGRFRDRGRRATNRTLKSSVLGDRRSAKPCAK